MHQLIAFEVHMVEIKWSIFDCYFKLVLSGNENQEGKVLSQNTSISGIVIALTFSIPSNLVL